MSRKTKQHTKQFKLDAVNYRKEHPDLTQVECAKNLGIGTSTLGIRCLQNLWYIFKFFHINNFF